MSFDTTLWLPQIQEPVMILHARDDQVIPFALAQELFENTKKQKENVEFFPFDADLKLKHDGIFEAIEQNPNIVTDFVEKVIRSD